MMRKRTVTSVGKIFVIGDEVKCLSYWCPKCKYKLHANCSIMVSMESENGYDDITNMALDRDIIPFVKCPKCNNWMVDIDNEIFDAICSINDYGYKTEFCCSGHVEHEDSPLENLSLPYVIFDHNDQLNSMLLSIANRPEYKDIITVNPDKLYTDETEYVDAIAVRITTDFLVALTYSDMTKEEKDTFDEYCITFRNYLTDVVKEIEDYLKMM